MVYTLIIFVVLGLVLGLILAFASKKFHVATDPKLDEIVEALPGANCGACGFPGCAGCSHRMEMEQAPYRSGDGQDQCRSVQRRSLLIPDGGRSRIHDGR